jgi:hypothetical protein
LRVLRKVKKATGLPLLICHQKHIKLYFALKNLVLPRVAEFSMGLAFPALRESEFSGSA